MPKTYKYTILLKEKPLSVFVSEKEAIKQLKKEAEKFGLFLIKEQKPNWIERNYQLLKEEFGDKEFYFKSALRFVNISNHSLSALFKELRKQKRLLTRLSQTDSRIRIYQLL